jgi:hypothetical protein
MKANKGFLAIGAKARLSQNPDVLLRNTMINEWCYRDDNR